MAEQIFKVGDILYDSSHILAVNKLIIILLIKEMGFTLSSSQIVDFVTSNGYADYFSIQQYIAELCNSNFLKKFEKNHMSYYMITTEGIKALDAFSQQIPQYIKNNVMQYVESNSNRLKNEPEITAEYIPKKSDEFLVSCSIIKDNSSIINLTVKTVSEKDAKLICDNWTDDAMHLYESIYNFLAKKSQLM